MVSYIICAFNAYSVQGWAIVHDVYSAGRAYMSMCGALPSFSAVSSIGLPGYIASSTALALVAAHASSSGLVQGPLWFGSPGREAQLPHVAVLSGSSPLGAGGWTKSD